MCNRIERLVIVSVLTALGAFVGLTCLGAAILGGFYGYDHGFGETAKSDIGGAVIGAVVGAVLAWQYLDRKPSTPD
jgi:hypothetical protein